MGGFCRLNEKILDVQNLTKSYGDNLVLKGLNFEVYAGEIFGFIGPNGAGKSTLINIICGLTRPDSGQVFVCSHSITNDYKKASSNIGAVVENSSLFSYMTGYQNLQYFAGLAKNIKKYDIDKVVKTVGLDNVIHKKVKTYSFGMRQRLNLAQAILTRPRLLVLDEPTNGLDVNGIIEFRQLLKYLARKYNIAILISSHILSEIEQTCDTVAIFDRGAILELRTLSGQDKNDTKHIQITVDYPNYAAKILSLKFGINAEIVNNTIILPYMPDFVEKIIEALKNRDVKVLNMQVTSKSLEDFYLNTISNAN